MPSDFPGPTQCWRANACADPVLPCSAVQEVAIALVRLHQRFTFELAPELQTGDLELTFNITFKPKGGLPMTLKPRA